MSKLPRWDIDDTGCSYPLGEGDWCKAEDVVRLETELTAAQAEIKRLKKQFADFQFKAANQLNDTLTKWRDEKARGDRFAEALREI